MIESLPSGNGDITSLFCTKARCMNCHFGPSLSDEQFHNVGLSYYGRKYEDLGRY